MLAFCAFIYLLLKFATCLGRIPPPRPYYSLAAMTGASDADTANSSARASANYLKDRLGAEPLTALSKVNLNNRKLAGSFKDIKYDIVMYTKNAPQTTMDTKARNPGRDQKTRGCALGC